MIESLSPLLSMSIEEIGAGYRDGRWTPVEVTRAAMKRIEQTEPLIRAWAAVDADRALASAAKAAFELSTGEDRGPLHGIPVGVKDIFDVSGWTTRCGSAARDDAPHAAQDAAVVDKLVHGGAVLMGKTVTQEFAAGVVSAPARNPWDPDRIPGGSSGGSAAAVALGACFGALGSDTGGSIRIPAAACGVVGFKPTFGALDVAGVFPLSWSLDTVGPITRSVGDAWSMWQILKGDKIVQSPEYLDAESNARQLRVGLVRDYFLDWVQPDVRANFESAIETLGRREVRVIDVTWPLAAAARACAFMINRVETAAVHERIAVLEPDRFARYGPELRLRVAAGRSIPAVTYVDALRARLVVRDSMAGLFAEHRLDGIVVPTLATTALAADRLVIEGTGRAESVGAAWTRLTMPFNATGQPVLAVPCGRDQLGLPVGLQIAGMPGRELAIFQVGRLLEEALGWRTARPPLLATQGADG